MTRPSIYCNKATYQLRFHKRCFVGSLLSLAWLCILVAMLVAANVLDNTLVPGCETVNGTITQFGVYDYVPTIYEKWINVSYCYTVANVTYDRNLFFGEVSRSAVTYYKDQYAPVGRSVTVAYLLANVSDSYVGGCPPYYGWAMILNTLFGIGVFVSICALYAAFLHYCSNDKTNETAPLSP